MQIIQNITDLNKALSQLKNQTTVLIPTMGALHDGHIELIKEAREDGKLPQPVNK